LHFWRDFERKEVFSFCVGGLRFLGGIVLADCFFGGILNAKRSCFVLADCAFLEELCWQIAFLEGF